jgi:FkbM family methyltransferase
MRVLKAFPPVANVIRQAAGFILHAPEIAIAKETIGSAYGAHTIPRSTVDADSIVYSFGIGDDASFDLGLIGRYGCTVHGFDPTPRSGAWVAANVSDPRFVFHPMGIAGRDGDEAFDPPKRETHMSFSPARTAEAQHFKVARLATIMAMLGHDRLDILKMDVEGFEYAALEDMMASGIRPRAIAVEYHHRMYGITAAQTNASVGGLQRYGYQLFHVSETGREYSFIDGAEM